MSHIAKKSLKRYTGLMIVIALMGCEGKQERMLAYYDRAQAYYDAGNFEKAEVEIRNSLKVEGDFADGRYLHALIYEQEQNWQQVWANLRLVIELEPTHRDGLMKLSQLEYLANQLDKAISHVEIVLQQAPEDVDALALSAMIHLKQGQPDRAETAANNALAIDPLNVAAVSVLANIYASQSPERALTLVTSRLESTDNPKPFLIIRAKLELAQGDTTAAFRTFEDLIHTYPNDLVLANELYQLYMLNGELAAAEKLINHVAEQHPDNAELNLNVVKFEAQHRSTVAAEATVKKLMEAHPGEIQYRMALAELYVNQKKFDAAESILRRAVDTDEDTARVAAMNQLIKVLLIQNKEAEAGDWLKKVFEIESENYEALVTQARIFLTDGDTKSAVNALRTAIKNQQRPISALMLLSQTHTIDGERALALDNLRQVLSLEPNHTPALLKTAELEITQGNSAAARTLLEKALELDANNSQAILMLVQLYANLQEWDKGLAYAEELLADKKSAPLGHYLKGRLLLAQDKIETALEQFLLSHQRSPRAREPLSAIVQTYQTMQQPQAAERYLKAHLNSYPDDAQANNMLGMLLHQRSPSKGTEYFKQAAARFPDDATLQLSLARALLADEKIEAAETLLKNAGVNHNKDTRFPMALASLAEQQARHDAAIEHYRHVLSIDPDSILAANNLINILIDHQLNDANLEAAVELSSLLRNRSNPAVLDTLGWLAYHSGKLEEARGYFTRLINSGAAEPITYFHMAATQKAIDAEVDTAKWRQQALAKARTSAEKALLDAKFETLTL